MTEQTRDHLKFTAEHEWIEIDGSTATIGITPYAQEALGDVVFVELPEVGQELTKGDEFAVIESVKAASEVYTPLSGEIVEVNEELNDVPESINESPFDDAWIVKIRISDVEEQDELMSASSYEEFIEGLV